MIEPVLFIVAAAVAVISASLVIIQRHPVYSAIYLILTFCALATLYIILAAQFIAMVQVIVYAGAIMVLFVFIIFLLRLDRPFETQSKLKHQKAVAVTLAACLFFEGVFLFQRGLKESGLATKGGIPSEQFGTIQQVGSRLFEPSIVFAFEATSLILLVAMIGVVVLAKRHAE